MQDISSLYELQSFYSDLNMENQNTDLIHLNNIIHYDDTITYFNSYYINKAKKESKLVVKDNIPSDITEKSKQEIKNMSKEEKKNRRRSKNCISAKYTLKKKKKYIDLLEKYIIELENKVNCLQNN